MLTIRLTRKGKKNQPFFRVVIIDKRSSTKGGRAVEDLGYVDPLKKRKSFNKERIQYWISKGAQTSATIHNMLVTEKIIDEKKIHVSKLSKKAKEKIAKATETAAAEKAAEVAAAEKAAATPAPAAEEKPVEVATPEVVVSSEEKPAEETKA